MHLVEPTDFEILEVMYAGGGKRNTAANVSHLLDKDRAYVNTRFPALADHGLLEKIGPARNSGLYEITEKGDLVVEHQQKYRDDENDFEAFIEERTP